MSSPLAMAAVTAVLKDLLNDGLLNHDLSKVGSFSVTALPPDRVTTGQNEPNQLNVFLYQVTANLGWRNAGLPSRDSEGRRTDNAPLALDLHYLLTAYGSQDFNAEMLLGYAMQLLHENPVLTRAQLRKVLEGAPTVDGTVLKGPFGDLSALDLADQVELIKITPVFLNTEELSKMWTAMQARYRPTMAYMASVVLIQRTGGVRTAPPVLKRGRDDSGPVVFGSPSPTLVGAQPAGPAPLPAMRLGDDLIITGTNLNAEGKITAIFSNPNLKGPLEITAPPSTSPDQLTIHIPSITEDAKAMSDWVAGLYSVSLRVERQNSVPVPRLPPTAPGPPAPPAQSTTNSVPIALSPSITVSPLKVAPGDGVTISCTPRVTSDQKARVMLIFGDQQISAKSIKTPKDTIKPSELVFTVPKATQKGTYLVRLRVDGIDSLPVTLTKGSAKLDFDPQQQVVVK